MDKTTLWFIAGFVALVVVVVIYAGVSSGGFATSSSTSTSPGFVATVAAPITSADHVEGSATSTVSLIEYGDFECPACEDYEPMVQQVLQSYGSRISFVFREYPLTTIHPLAQIAAQAAEAASLQGKFWQMHDALYLPANWNQWTTSDPGAVVGQYFDKYAASIGLNISQFDKDINSSAVVNMVQADVNSGNAASVNHTPTFFVDLAQIPNPASYSDFQSALDAALASPSSAATSTIPTAASSTK